MDGRAVPSSEESGQILLHICTGQLMDDDNGNDSWQVLSSPCVPGTVLRSLVDFLTSFSQAGIIVPLST